MNPSVHIVLEIVRKEFHQIRQDKRMLAVSIMAPFLQVIFLGYAATTDVKNASMVVCDADRTPSSREFIREFSNSGYFVDVYRVDSPSDMDEVIERGDAAVGLVVPPDFAERLLERETASVQMLVDGADANTGSILLGYASQIVAQYSQKILLETLPPAHGTAPARILPEPRVWYNPELLSKNYMVPGVVALVLMIITTTLTSLGIVKEREIGTLEQLMVTPIRPHELIFGKLIPFVIIGAIDVTIVLSIARFWFEVPLRGSILLLYGLSGLFVLTTLGLGILVSTISKSQQQAMLIAQFFFFMPFMFLSGFAFPISNMPEVIQYLTYLIPLRYFLEIVRGVFLKGVGMAELWPQVVALFVLGVLILTLSVLRFRRKLT